MAHRLYVILAIMALFCLNTLPSSAQAPAPHGFYYPVESLNPSSGFLASECDTYFSQSYHLGWDLLQSLNSPVYAITDGTIVNINPHGDPSGTDPNLIWIWIKHSVIDPNGNPTFIYAVYGHTKIAAGLQEGSTVNSGQLIGYTVDHTKYSADHCHLGINPSGYVTVTKIYTIHYFDHNDNNQTTTVEAGWGSGGADPKKGVPGLPSDWCAYKSQNIPLLQASGAVENFIDPKTFFINYSAVGYGGGVSDPANIYVSLSGSDAGNGSPSAPFRTIKHAIDLASAGGATIYISPGTYGEKNSSSGKHIHFVVNGSGVVRTGG